MKTLFFLLFPFLIFSQQEDETAIDFYLETGEKISLIQFLESKDYSKNIDLEKFIDGKSAIVLYNRIRSGYLTAEQLNSVRELLSSDGNKVLEKDFLVIQYLTTKPKEQINGGLRGYVFQKNHFRKVTKKYNAEIYYVSDERNFPKISKFDNKFRKWIKDKDAVFSNFFYPAETRYGNFTIISKDGRYISYLGEHSPEQVYQYLNFMLRNRRY